MNYKFLLKILGIILAMVWTLNFVFYYGKNFGFLGGGIITSLIVVEIIILIFVIIEFMESNT